MRPSSPFYITHTGLPFTLASLWEIPWILANLCAATGPQPTITDPNQNIGTTGCDFDWMLYEVIDEGHAQESTVPQEAAENGFEIFGKHSTVHHSQQQGSMLKFLEEAENSHSVNMMDIPLYACSRPWFIDGIADDIMALRATHTVTDSTSVLFPANLPRMGAWALATTGRYWTNFHHDTQGTVTWTTPSCGAKIWVLLTPKYIDTNPLMEALGVTTTIRQCDDPAELEKHFHVTSVLLECGSWLIQPPAQFHAVYTPIQTIMYSGHMLVLDSIHQTLVTRRLELLTNHVTTNASHPAID
ncbi:hypothetical protein K466DRAFT_601132 [Polyporus arcularius HHB13444]|uniref:JmjC domain-containing protein n=1 Tax=Polyporus arcularius HHB13444 TaxID=1314778 RepID=A0A5C3P6Z8_9APHY|nr:hypothetical protein K466DRAFT_601132 [Polyporus arcularius HHB13444]